MENMVIISEEENEKMIDMVEDINALNVLVKTLSTDNELFKDKSDLYEKIKKDMKRCMHEYKIQWRELIMKYNLDPSKADNYILDFEDRSIHCETMS